MAMLHPTKASSNFTSKSFTPVGMKSKGLSIRSQSDLNIGVTQSAQSSLKAGDAKKNLPTPHQDKVSKVNIIQLIILYINLFSFKFNQLGTLWFY